MTGTNADSGLVHQQYADAPAAGTTVMTDGVMGSLTLEPEEAERMIALLETSGRYRILRRLESRDLIHAPDGTSTRRGIFLDVETTGLDPATDEIIELAMLAFDYADDGRIFTVHEPFDALRNPGRPIPAAVTALTGITDEMVANASIEPAEVAAFIANASLIIAHNAKFDRRFCEKFCDAFATKPWGCSMAEIHWTEEGFEAARLSQIAAGHGFFYDGHRALHDCQAGIEILARPLPKSGRTALAALLKTARLPQWRVWAIDAPYELRHFLKARKYRWNDGSDGRPKSWFVDIDIDACENEFEFLRRKIYRKHDIDIHAQKITALERYSGRC
jgi:DNA polymerase III subunit epsilon